jgi:hypothetical protein
MSEQVRGCHHCIGTGVTVTDLVFKFIENHVHSNERISPGDVSELRRRFLDSFTHGYDFFETIHRKCMNASKSANAQALSRDNILPSLLLYCGRGAAEAAFKLELASCGDVWLDDFFAGFAKYVGTHVYKNAEAELVKVFVGSAGKHKSNLTVEKLLREAKAQEILSRCVEAFTDQGTRQAMAEPISVAVNNHIAMLRHIIGANQAKTTEDDIRFFLEKLPSEVRLAIKANRSSAV